MNRHLMTGATGFVGGAIALELLDRTSDHVVAVVRRGRGADPTARLRKALREMAVGYDRTHLLGAVDSRVSAVEGDITEPGCGVDGSTLGGFDQFWHCAASLRYEEEFREEIERHNVDGTEHAIDLVRQLNVPTLNYISTAYVAGARSGVVLEEPSTRLDLANNVYEASKMRAEQLVAAEGEMRRVRILRPSIVIGHSVTLHGVNYSGMYGFAKTLLAFKHRSADTLGTYLSHVRLRLLAEPDIPVNLVPVDVVARNAVSIALSGSTERYFHLANATPPTVGLSMAAVMALLGFRVPIWVTERDGFTAIDETLNAGMDFYGSYLLNGKSFVTTNTQAVSGTGSCDVPLDSDRVGAFLRYYLETRPTFSKVSAQPLRVLYCADVVSS